MNRPWVPAAPWSPSLEYAYPLIPQPGVPEPPDPPAWSTACPLIPQPGVPEPPDPPAWSTRAPWSPSLEYQLPPDPPDWSTGCPLIPQPGVSAAPWSPSLEYRLPPNGRWGTGVSTGVRGQVYRRETDFGLLPFVESLLRRRHFDFSYRLGVVQWVCVKLS